MSCMFAGAITPDLLNNLNDYGVISNLSELSINYLSTNLNKTLIIDKINDLVFNKMNKIM